MFRYLLFFCIFTTLQLHALKLTQEQKAYIKSNPVIKVQNEADYIPVNFNDRGEPKGYSIDYIKLLAAKVGLEVAFVSGHSWHEYLQMIQDKELHVLLNVVKNSQREHYLNFTQPYLKLYPSLFSRKDDRINSLEALKGKVLAVPSGYYFIPYFEKYYPDITILITKDNLSCLNAVASSKADATIGFTYTMRQLLKDHFIDDVELSSGYLHLIDMEQNFERIGVRKDLKILYTILDEAMQSIGYEQTDSIKEKWLGYSSVVAEKNGVRLTKEELAYLKEKKQLRYCIDPSWMPIEGLNGDKHEGMSAEYFDLIKQKLPISLELVQTNSWSQSLQKVINRECDLVSLAMQTKRLKKNMDFTHPYIEIPLVIATKTDEFFISDIELLNNKKVAIVKDYAYYEILKNDYPQIEVVAVKNIKEGLDKTVQSQVYGFVDTLATIGYQFQKNYIGELKIAGKFDQTWQLSIATRNDEPHLVSIFDKILHSIDKKKKKEILDRWISVEYETRMDKTALYKILAAVAIVFSFLLYRQYMLKRYNNKLQYLSSHDTLTHLYNRMHLDKSLDLELQRIERFKQPLSIVIFDIDDFKHINDKYGHQVGDAVIVKVAQILKENTRKIDTLGRWGGEEFMLVATATDCNGAEQIAQKILDRISNEDFKHGIHITMSAGVAQHHEKENQTELFQRADNALYEAKENGKDRVVINCY
ncbi:MAG: transporter substrate-binding domain-containing diguanylate cyclase [Campylobacterota bacterium]